MGYSKEGAIRAWLNNEITTAELQALVYQNKQWSTNNELVVGKWPISTVVLVVIGLAALYFLFIKK